MVATNDSHYLCGEDSHAHDVMLCVQTGSKVHDKERMRFDTDQFLSRVRTRWPCVQGRAGGVAADDEIAERCNLKLHAVTIVSGIRGAGGHSIDSYFEQVCRGAIKKRLDTSIAQLGARECSGRRRMSMRRGWSLRLDHQADEVRGYFLIVWDFIKYARDHGIPVGPGADRRRVAGGVLMEITNVDPLQNSLLFERFLNPERVTMPDIDVDFCQDGPAR